MKKPKIKSEGVNYSAVNVGMFDNLMDYSYMHPKTNQEIQGKVFLGEILKSTGTEISFQTLPPNTEIPFLHQHKKHEEIYVFLKGSGQFQVDSDIFDVTEGTVIRVAPDGKRYYRNNSDMPLTYICIQVQEGSLSSHFIEDGFRVEGDRLW